MKSSPATRPRPTPAPRRDAPPRGPRAEAPASRRRAAALAALLVLLVVLVYVPAMQSGFLWDDVSIYVVDNPLVKAPDGLFRFWFTSQATDYYPVTNSLFWFEWHLFGERAAGYHVVTVLLHALASLLLWRVLQRLAVPGAWVGAAVFALHPVQVESVAWIAQTKNTLSLSFFLAALLAWLRFDAGGRWRAVLAALGLFVLAVLSKTSAATLPVVMLGATWWRRGRLGRRDLLAVLPFVVIAIGLGLLATAFQGRTSGALAAAAEPLAARAAAAGWCVWFYVSKVLVPVGLTLVYPRWSVNAANPLAWLPGVAVLAVFGVAWRWRRAWGRPVLAGFGWFVVNLLPVLGFVGIGFMAHTRVTDHWQYTAMAGLVALGVGAAAHGLRARPPLLRVGAAAAALVLLAVLTSRQAGLYVDEERLWRDNLRKNPRAWVAHNNLGQLLALQGRFAEAEPHLQHAVQLMPDYGDALVNLGNVLDEMGRVEEAAQRYEHALRVSGPDPILHYNMALVLEKRGDVAGAAQHYAAVLRLRPDDAEAHQRRALLLARAGRDLEAVPHYRALLRLRPGDLDAANRLAWALVSAPTCTAAEAAEAIELATGVCRATDFRDPGPLDVLAAAYARAGRLDAAIDTARRALAHASALGDSQQAEQIRTRLALYEARRAAAGPGEP